MAYESRDYFRDEQRRYSGGGFGGGGRFGGSGRFASAPVSLWLIVANVAVFLWNALFGGSHRGSMLAFNTHGFFSVDTAIYGGQVWRLLTYQFLHADFFHLLFNMIGVFFFGPLLEMKLRSKPFLLFYLLCGVGGAIIATILGPIPGVLPPSAPLIGASGALFGILAAAAYYYPHQEVRLLFPPIPLKMRTLCLIFLGIAAVSVIAGSANAGGEACHLGGAAAGFLLARFPGVLGVANRVDPRAIADAPRNAKAAALAKKQQRALERLRKDEAEADRILDKVRDQGLQSLSQKEKDTLNRATARRNAG